MATTPNLEGCLNHRDFASDSCRVILKKVSCTWTDLILGAPVDTQIDKSSRTCFSNSCYSTLGLTIRAIFGEYLLVTPFTMQLITNSVPRRGDPILGAV